MVNQWNGVGASGRNGTKRNRDRKLSSVFAVVNAVMMAGALRAAAEDAAPASSAPAPAPAQPSASQDPAIDPSKLQEVIVTAKPEGDYQVTESANGKYTEPLRDTPQSVTIIPQSLIKDQNASSLKEALQNVPGITFTAGEGGTLAGDNINIRGYNAHSDIFVDGFRDTGVYNRDPFNLEQIEVVKGPASVYSGHGSTGGSVNLITKEASLTPSYKASSGYGTDQYYRETVDINQPLGQLGEAFQTTAFRLNAMYQSNEHSERDIVYDSRWGIDPTLTWGLGTDTKVTVDYLHLDEDDLPSYGLPVVTAGAVNGVAPSTTGGVTNPGVAANPSLASSLNHVAPVPYSNFYGLAGRDFEHSTTDIPTLKISHDFGEELQIENTSRYENTLRAQDIASTRFESGVIPGISPSTIVQQPSGDMARENRARRQVDGLIGNQTEFKGKFDTWRFTHDWVFTLEASRETEDARTSAGGNTIASPPSLTSLLNPTPYDPYPFPLTWGAATKTSISDYAFSLFDSIKLDPHWILSGGMRFDHAESNQTGGGLRDLSRIDDLPSYRAALTYKPIEPVSVYFGYGTSYNLSIESTASDTSSPDGLTVASSQLAPEKNTTYEFGTKWDALHEKLSLGAAFFRTMKDNTRITDPTTTLVTNAGSTRVQGIELSAAGNLTKEWKVFGGYTYMESEILSSPIAGTIGNRLPNVPAQSASLWSTYDLPAHVTLGTGAVFVDVRYANTSGTTVADGYWTQALMAAYRPEKWLEFQVNVANLWDEHYIAATGSNSIPGDGRSIVFTTSVKF